MKRTMKLHLVVLTLATAFASAPASAGMVFDNERGREASAASGAAAPNKVVVGSAYLTAAERAAITSNPDGTVTRKQYMDGMEGRWDKMEKDDSGNLPAAALAAPQAPEERQAPRSVTPY